LTTLKSFLQPQKPSHPTPCALSALGSQLPPTIDLLAFSRVLYKLNHTVLSCLANSSAEVFTPSTSECVCLEVIKLKWNRIRVLIKSKLRHRHIYKKTTGRNRKKIHL
jgi:hypothetical protein